MANINDFKNVKQRAKKYSEYLGLDDANKKTNGARFGFYLLILECVTSIKDIDELKNMVIDTEFSSVVFKEKNNDLGVDAVHVNLEDRVIQLFNFKYRDTFKINSGLKLGDMVDVSKFLLPIVNGIPDGMTDLTKQKVELIIEKLESDEEWKLELYMVSNENHPLELEDPTVIQFKDNYGMQVQSITLEEIVAYISDLPQDLNAKFVIDSESVMTYEMDTLSTLKSYLIKLSLADLIRITCSDEKMRMNPTEEYKHLQGQSLEMSLLFDNVRGYLGSNTKFNGNIIKTIKDDPNKFFMFNNGMTITVKDIKAGYQNGRKKFGCEIKGFQIVNGGQTLRSIYEFCNNQFDEEKLANAEILVRLFQTEADKELTNDIAEYTNSQNAISSIDLKSISNFQIQLSSYLETYGILYVRKAGDTGGKEKEYNRRIPMDKVAQIIYSDMGFPDRATNQKNALFEKYYNNIFDEENLDFDNVLNLINLYYEIEDMYEKSETVGFHQKYLYVIFLSTRLENSLEECIEALERFILEYKREEELSAARKLIQKGFKDHVVESIESQN
ncbi:hypothetical protein A5867_000050 [Enterococcus sp. 6D12_DIV0197]|uniref:AIPR family protein n=1 Tax=Enterococcus sp. 6D12_DIV0197 TaxID=1834184 RepID=UPI000B3ECA4F|nr:AIPR family protein [Enterococcus sp. 6D12_DIV0197]OUZ22380.1 hypothetical protein A5867_000050 [Enterococcus sp. 6D12_DIV0197]